MSPFKQGVSRQEAQQIRVLSNQAGAVARLVT
jgi:hypothetical protein